jgi:heat shock protein HtpX
MATLYTQQDKNVRKTWLLMALFLAIVVGLGYFLSYYYQNPSILYFAIIFSIVMNVISYWYSDKIVTKLAGAKEVPDAEPWKDLHNSVENLAITAGLPKPRVFVIEDPAPNAFATGRNKEHAVVAVTTGLLGMMNKTELEGVLAHELSHVGNRDILLSTVVVVLVGFISILANIFTRSMWFGGGRRNDDREGVGGIGAVLMLLGVIFIVLSPIIATLIQLAISRKREYLADASGALLTRYPEGLASALEKIGKYSRPMARQQQAIAHLYIADPGGKMSRIARLFMTHPPIEERIKILRGMK